MINVLKKEPRSTGSNIMISLDIMERRRIITSFEFAKTDVT